ncbi:hypothetical protein EII14_04230 [Alloprevotella sp. OH1205_COT-284]|uniref:hypothetical protein n=1 Tax=Alloprevotella sp. OH1205_COT-284 TaxID=2491043 RepID=UPI000F5ECCB1|nr:hypothetical protein [Alloprevotella sp. OH1205_COT-284]RRD80046.1 hypothetical protein EII14_04230 [Alloprevotella sp. OH1205_COT-284]
MKRSIPNSLFRRTEPSPRRLGELVGLVGMVTKTWLLLLFAVANVLAATAQNRLLKAIENLASTPAYLSSSSVENSSIVDEAHPFFRLHRYEINVPPHRKAQVRTLLLNGYYDDAMTGRSKPNSLHRYTSENRERYSVSYSPEHTPLIIGDTLLPNLVLVRTTAPQRPTHDLICAAEWDESGQGLRGRLYVVERLRGVKAKEMQPSIEERLRDFRNRFRNREEWPYSPPKQPHMFFRNDTLFIPDVDTIEWKTEMNHFSSLPNIEAGSMEFDNFEAQRKIAVTDYLRRLAFYNRKLETSPDGRIHSAIRHRTSFDLPPLLSHMSKEELERARKLIEQLKISDKRQHPNSSISDDLLQPLSKINTHANATAVSSLNDFEDKAEIDGRATGTLILEQGDKKWKVDYARRKARFDIVPDEHHVYDVSRKIHRIIPTDGVTFEYRFYSAANGVFLTYKGKEYSRSRIDGASDEPLPFLTQRYIGVGDMETSSKEVLILTFDRDLTLDDRKEAGIPPIVIKEGSYLMFETDTSAYR